MTNDRVYTMAEIKDLADKELDWIEDWAKTQRLSINGIPDDAHGWEWAATVFVGHKYITRHWERYNALCHAAVETNPNL